MTNKPRIAILVLNYNRSSDTILCIKSILNIDYNNYDILVVDNYSTDNSYSYINEKLEGIEVIQTHENLGYTGGVNYGIKYLIQKNYEYILNINNDTIVEPDFLSKLVDAIEKESNVAVACGTILCEHDRDRIWYGPGKIISWRGLAIHLNKNKKYYPNEKYEKVSFVSGCLMLLRVSSLKVTGLFDERFFMYLDDIEFSRRAISSGFSLIYVPNSIIYHKVFGEKESAFKIYYSVRNRLLLIKLAFPGFAGSVARVYFLTVIIMKLIKWFAVNKGFFKAAKFGLQDYFMKKFYKGRGMIFLPNRY